VKTKGAGPQRVREIYAGLTRTWDAKHPGWRARAEANVARDLADRRAARADADRWIEQVKARKAAR
jgi:hypothetical protein